MLLVKFKSILRLDSFQIIQSMPFHALRGPAGHQQASWACADPPFCGHCPVVWMGPPLPLALTPFLSEAFHTVAEQHPEELCFCSKDMRLKVREQTPHWYFFTSAWVCR